MFKPSLGWQKKTAKKYFLDIATEYIVIAVTRINYVRSRIRDGGKESNKWTFED